MEGEEEPEEGPCRDLVAITKVRTKALGLLPGGQEGLEQSEPRGRLT